VPDRLADISLKITRAREHLEDLDRRILVWTDENTLDVIHDHDARTGWHVLRVGRLRNAPREWAVLIGDWAHNHRSALDYLLEQLVFANGGAPSRSNQFPIYSQPPPSPARFAAMVRGVSAAAEQVIADMQPYRRSGRTSPEPLEILSDLSNHDKHHHLHAVAVLTAPFDQRWVKVTLATPTRIDEIAVPAAVYEPITDAGIFAMRVSPPETRVGLELSHRLPIDIAFKNAHLVRTADLRNIADEVSRVVERLSPFLG
jgi:hypothetical protein